jgi:hypothetical protein
MGNYDDIFEMIAKQGMNKAKIKKLAEEFKVRDQEAMKYRQSIIAVFEELIPKYERCLNEAKCEEDVQKFLTENPLLAKQAFEDGSMALDIVPKFKLGQDFVTDFVMLGMRSFNSMYHVVMVELESPLDKPFTKDGLFSQHLNKAIQQVQDWSDWLNNKFETFCADFPDKLTRHKGTDLRNALRRAKYTYKIVIGRHRDYTTEDRFRRGSLFLTTQGRIEIMSFDRLLDIAKYYVDSQKDWIKPDR